MTDGYYLFTYLEIDPLGSIYGLSQRHDCNVSLWEKNGETVSLKRYWELERLTGRKEYRGAFRNAEQALCFLNTLLDEFGLTTDDMEEILGTPGLDTADTYADDESTRTISYHSICHLFSGILADTEIFYHQNIIGLAVDAGPDVLIQKDLKGLYYYAGCVVDHGRVTIFPVSSPALLWMIASSHYQLKEGTLMALASASKSKSLEQFPMRLDTQMDGDAGKFMKYFYELVSRIDGYEEKDKDRLFNEMDPLFSVRDNKISMVMKEVQKVSMNMMAANIEDILEEYPIDPEQTYLSVSGGYALNCPTNSYLLEKYHFKDFITAPCVNDSGMSMGMALFYFWKNMGTFSFKLQTAYHGCIDPLAGDVFERDFYRPYIAGITDFNEAVFVSDIDRAPVVWFDGASEIGPRALGNRSLLAAPTSLYMKDELNRIKQRQWWRPVAPIVLQEKAHKWFKDASNSPFMLRTFEILPDKRERIPAVAHIDNSARIQTINEDDNPLLYRAIQSFEEANGVPILCNTSLNDQGEPIINTAEEALNFALRKRIDIMYVNGKRVQLQNHQAYPSDRPLARRILVEEPPADECRRISAQYNPYGIDDESLGLYYMMPEVYASYDLRDKDSSRFLYLFTSRIKKMVR